jgi:hypothetical protein
MGSIRSNYASSHNSERPLGHNVRQAQIGRVPRKDIATEIFCNLSKPYGEDLLEAFSVFARRKSGTKFRVDLYKVMLLFTKQLT